MSIVYRSITFLYCAARVFALVPLFRSEASVCYFHIPTVQKVAFNAVALRICSDCLASRDYKLTLTTITLLYITLFDAV